MKTIIFPDNKLDIEIKNGIVMALGKFESVHLGHRRIFEVASKFANDNNMLFGIMLFTERKANNLFSIEERKMFMQEYSPDFFMEFEPSLENFKWTYTEFENYLKSMNVKKLVVGEDFTYGNNRVGTSQMLQKAIDTTIVKFIKYKDEKVSTSRIIKTLNKGELRDYRNMMNHYYFYSGNVIHGLGNGKKFGMPTINVDYPKNKIEIEDGIFYSYVIYNGQRMNSLTSISFNPTLNASNKTYETYIYDFNKDIYDEYVYVELIEKMRDPVKFESVDNLIVQLDKDKKMGKTYFEKSKKGRI